MRRHLLVATACALGLTSASSAKEEMWGLRICGASGCRDILRWQNWVDGTTTGPVSASAYFSISYLDRRGKPVSSDWPSLYYVPAADVLRRDGGIATWVSPSGADLREAVRGLRPFPRPRLARVIVGDRRARDPDSYLRLYELPSSQRPPADPAGTKPSDRNALWRYYERVRRHWIAVNLWSARPTPWGDGANFVWISRRGALLRRDGELLRIPPALAERVRRGASLRGV
jgi:hypothetical protein